MVLHGLARGAAALHTEGAVGRVLTGRCDESRILKKTFAPADLRCMGQESSSIADYSNKYVSIRRVHGVNSCACRNLKEIPEDGFNGLLVEDLCLAHNSLVTIPTSINLLSTLRALDLSSNLLRELPSTLPSVLSLTSLKLSRNALTALPPNIGELVNLVDLYASMSSAQILTSRRHVDHNELTELPPSIGTRDSPSPASAN